MRVLGVDACRRGWVGISGDLRGYFGATIADVVAAADDEGRVSVVGIDIPIGLSSSGPRVADQVVRRLVGARASSVFATPVRAALEAPTHAEATALNVAATGKGISQQAFALRHKILDVDRWLPSAGRTVLEVHPELGFATAAGAPLRHPKSTWAGGEERRAILAAVGLTVPAELGTAGAMAGVDDVLDAAIVAWTAQRYADGRATCHPDPPEDLGGGVSAAIWA
ncbi:DUF429 domain-containing protein [Nocardioides sp. GY 10113]|uniref:DUF429 domain-containing protein n=1 Tax=Nocardioides sp. GY 10113 TaxID=2569761 RepID=UPI001458D0D4|nr:DUF429 domain-containing protein [Nocardioides sp. GY 10113]